MLTTIILCGLVWDSAQDLYYPYDLPNVFSDANDRKSRDSSGTKAFCGNQYYWYFGFNDYYNLQYTAWDVDTEIVGWHVFCAGATVELPDSGGSKATVIMYYGHTSDTTLSYESEPTKYVTLEKRYDSEFHGVNTITCKG